MSCSLVLDRVTVKSDKRNDMHRRMARMASTNPAISKIAVIKYWSTGSINSVKYISDSISVVNLR